MILYIAYIFYSQKIIHSDYIVYYRAPGRSVLPQKVQKIARYFNTAIFCSESIPNWRAVAGMTN